MQQKAEGFSTRNKVETVQSPSQSNLATFVFGENPLQDNKDLIGRLLGSDLFSEKQSILLTEGLLAQKADFKKMIELLMAGNVGILKDIYNKIGNKNIRKYFATHWIVNQLMEEKEFVAEQMYEYLQGLRGENQSGSYYVFFSESKAQNPKKSVLIKNICLIYFLLFKFSDESSEFFKERDRQIDSADVSILNIDTEYLFTNEKLVDRDIRDVLIQYLNGSRDILLDSSEIVTKTKEDYKVKMIEKFIKAFKKSKEFKKKFKNATAAEKVEMIIKSFIKESVIVDLRIM